jgi:hypothetical protein
MNVRGKNISKKAALKKTSNVQNDIKTGLTKIDYCDKVLVQLA